MLLVVCPAPAVDRVAVVDFAPRRTLRPLRSFEWPGGSGVHAAHVAHQLGADVEVVGFVGGMYGERFSELVRNHGLTLTALASSVETRSTFTLIDRMQGNLFDCAVSGREPSDRSGSRLLEAVEAALPRADLLVVSGSLPLGVPETVHGDLVALAREHGVRVVADLTGTALVAALGARPWLVKPSLEELQRDGVTSGRGPDVVELAQSWVADGTEHVCVSLGAVGVLWVSASGCRRIGIAPARAYNTVGCGDTVVGALAAKVLEGEAVELALRQAVAAATANLARDEPGHCTPQEVTELLPETFVEDLDGAGLDRLLKAERLGKEGSGAEPGSVVPGLL